MGAVKRMMERDKYICGVAREIAIAAGALQHCEYHDSCVFQGPNGIEGAYELGNDMFTAGLLEGVFEGRREMTDCIKKVVEEVWGNECPQCAEPRSA